MKSAGKNMTKATYDFYDDNPNPFDEWHQEQLKIHELNYKDAIAQGSLDLEASLKDILYQAGYSDQNILALQEGALKDHAFYPKSFYRSRSWANGVNCTSYSYEDALAVLQANIHTPLKIHKKDKKKKKSADKSDDLSAANIKTHWSDEAAPVAKKHTVPKVLQYHPDTLDLVHIAKSSIIHYATPGRKSTLCGKKHVSSVKPEHAADPLYDVCAKCKAHFDASKLE